MKLIFTTWLAMILTAKAASTVDLHELGQPFVPPTNVIITWRASAGTLSRTVVVYKTEPNEFSPRVMSNLLALGGWSIQQRTHVPGRAAVPQDKDILHFGREGEPKQLSIYPPEGFIEYRDAQARAAMGSR